MSVVIVILLVVWLGPFAVLACGWLAGIPFLCSIVSGTVGAILSSNSQDAATEANQQNMRDTNATNIALNAATNAANLQLQQEARGSTGHSVLPYYMGGSEAAAGADATKQYQALLSNMLSSKDVKAIIDKYAGEANAGDKIASDILSGAWTNQALAEQSPVSSARTNVALSQRDTALASLNSTLNAIDAIQAKKGYVGDTFGERNTRFTALQNILGTSSQNMSSAALQNAQDIQRIQESGRNTQLSNINLGDQRSAAAIKRATQPNTTVAQQYSEALTPYSFFNTGYHAYTPYTGISVQNQPTVGANSLGANLASTGSTLGSTALSSYLKSNPSILAGTTTGVGSAGANGNVNTVGSDGQLYNSGSSIGGEEAVLAGIG